MHFEMVFSLDGVHLGRSEDARQVVLMQVSPHDDPEEPIIKMLLLQ